MRLPATAGPRAGRGDPRLAGPVNPLQQLHDAVGFPLPRQGLESYERIVVGQRHGSELADKLVDAYLSSPHHSLQPLTLVSGRGMVSVVMETPPGTARARGRGRPGNAAHPDRGLSGSASRRPRRFRPRQAHRQLGGGLLAPHAEPGRADCGSPIRQAARFRYCCPIPQANPE
jgi:hypothetical protein